MEAEAPRVACLLPIGFVILPLSAGWLERPYPPDYPEKDGMEVHAFLRVAFQADAWKQVWAEAGRITYKASQDRASIEIECLNPDQRLRFRADKGTKVAISGNSIHLPDGLR